MHRIHLIDDHTSLHKYTTALILLPMRARTWVLMEVRCEVRTTALYQLTECKKDTNDYFISMYMVHGYNIFYRAEIEHLCMMALLILLHGMKHSKYMYMLLCILRWGQTVKGALKLLLLSLSFLN